MKIRKYKKAKAPDKLQFQHVLSKQWFDGLAACNLDYQRRLYNKLVKGVGKI